MKSSFVLLFLVLTIPSLGLAQPTSASEMSNEIADSHIKANVPNETDFNTFLLRDLKAYFRQTFKKNVNVTYEMLRAGPTQTGIAYPKFYVWVKVFDGDNLLDQGAVRVAAIEKTRFDVTTFLSVADIESNPQKVSSIFPSALVPKIEVMAKEGK